VADALELLALASEIAREAGALLLLRLDDARTGVETKSSPTDMVSEVDLESEALIVRRILEARPGDAIVGEEGAARAGESGVTWVVDPLDGTTNYLYRRGDFCVSIGVERGGEALAGAVFDPVRDELFAAAAGHGARLNGAQIRVSAKDDLATALIGTGFGYDPGVRGRQGAVAARLLPGIRDVRRAGSAALDLCAVACGRLDGYYESGLNRWDMSAGLLIASEAGARTGFVEVPGERRAVVAAGPGTWEALAAAITSGGP
jgi:myo-inositol-1(or 4)-monophosphatase